MTCECRRGTQLNLADSEVPKAESLETHLSFSAWVVILSHGIFFLLLFL
jgi:hypothetical protein